MKHLLLLSVLKKLNCLIFLWKPWFFSRFIDEQSSKEQHLFKAEIFCNITNVFTVTFDEVNAPLLNSFIKKKKEKKSTDLVYVSIIYCTSSLIYIP